MRVVQNLSGSGLSVSGAASEPAGMAFTAPDTGLYAPVIRITSSTNDQLGGSFRLMHYQSDGTTIISRGGALISYVKNGFDGATNTTKIGANGLNVSNAAVWLRTGEVAKIVVIAGGAETWTWSVDWVRMDRGSEFSG